MNADPALLKGIEVVAFDFDGVIIEPNMKENPFKILAREYPDSDRGLKEIFEKMSNLRFDNTDWVGELELAGVDTGDKELLCRISDHIFEVSKKSLKTYPQVEAIIPDLSKRVRLAILSNNCRKTVYYCLPELYRHFASIKTFEDVTRLKPDPEGLMAIAEELRVSPEEVLLVGDSQDDVYCAARAGTKIAIATWSGNREYWQTHIGCCGMEIIFIFHPALLLQIIR